MIGTMTAAEGYDRAVHGIERADVNMSSLAAIVEKIRKHCQKWRGPLEERGVATPTWATE